MSATVTVSTSVILAPTQSTPGNYIVYFPNISTNGRLITVRDNDGYASTNHAVVLSTIGGAQFQTGVQTTQSQIYINQPFGFITLNSQASGRYTILNTFAFPEGSAAAFVNQVTTNNLVTSTIQLIDIGTQSTNTVFTSTGNMYLNSNLMGQVTYAQLNSTVVGLGEAGYISTIIYPNITPALNIATGFTSNQYYNGTKNPDGSIVYSVENQFPPLWKNATSGYSYGFSNGGNDVVVGTPFIVAVGDSYASSNSQSYIQISVDGSNWNYALAELSSPQVRLRASYANGIYHAIGFNSTLGGTPTIMWSRDGATWSNSVYSGASGTVNPFLGSNGYARGITYGNGKWVTVGYQPENYNWSIINSTDGSNWNATGIVEISLPQVWDVAFDGTYFHALCAQNTAGGNIVRSTDGINWLNIPTPYASSNFGIDASNGGYIAANTGDTNQIWLVTASNFAPSGQMLWYSQDRGDTWNANPFFNKGLLSRPYWDGAFWWIGYSQSNASNAPSIYYSANGITWSSNFAGSNSFVGGFPKGFASRNAQSNFAQALLSTTIGLSSNQSISSLRANTISTNSITAASITVSSLFVQVEIISTSYETINTISTVISDYTSTTQLFANQATLSSIQTNFISAGTFVNALGSISTLNATNISAATDTVSSLFVNYISAGRSLLTQTFGSSLQISTVGIRTANPQYALDVNGQVWARSTLYIGSNNSTNTLRFYGTNNDAQGQFKATVIGERIYDAAESSELLLFKGNDDLPTSGPDRVRVLAAGGFQVDVGTIDPATFFWEQGGNPPDAYIPYSFMINDIGCVGIGTSTPTVSLEINGPMKSGSQFYQNYFDVQNNADTISYGLTNSNNAIFNWNLSSQDDIPNQVLSNTYTLFATSPIGVTTKAIEVSTNGIVKFSSNVGINTNPQYPLDVNGTARIVNATIGDNTWPSGNYASFSYSTYENTSNYCLQQEDIGHTFLNSKWQKNIYLRTGNEPIMFCDGSNFRVGILNESPQYALDVTGQIRATDNITAYSDIRHKENIFRIENALSSVKEMRGVFYNPIGQSTQRVGVIAQEIEQVLPQVVCTDTTEQANKSVAYGNITAILIEAVKELSEKVDALSKK
jgi:hypothetical protein